jgi:hypothetical protein
MPTAKLTPIKNPLRKFYFPAVRFALKIRLLPEARATSAKGPEADSRQATPFVDLNQRRRILGGRTVLRWWSGRDAMMQVIRLLVGSLILLATLATPSSAAEEKFSCKGEVIQGMTKPAVQSKQVTLNVTLIDKSKLSIKAEDGQVVVPRITSNNKIQLRFATKDYVGEYFHYTGDLMLIYSSGLLARLNCSGA